jgi:hypothetical protein
MENPQYQNNDDSDDIIIENKLFDENEKETKKVKINK